MAACDSASRVSGGLRSRCPVHTHTQLTYTHRRSTLRDTHTLDMTPPPPHSHRQNTDAHPQALFSPPHTQSVPTHSPHTEGSTHKTPTLTHTHPHAPHPQALRAPGAPLTHSGPVMSFGAEDLPRCLRPLAPLLTSHVPLSCLRGPVWEVGMCSLPKGRPHTRTHCAGGRGGLGAEVSWTPGS